MRETQVIELFHSRYERDGDLITHWVMFAAYKKGEEEE